MQIYLQKQKKVAEAEESGGFILAALWKRLGIRRPGENAHRD
jgi:hypothetical protein